MLISFISLQSDIPHKKCIVPKCNSRENGSIPFFSVPQIASKVFKKWCNFVPLRGLREEKICKNHFQDTDMIQRMFEDLQIFEFNSLIVFYLFQILDES